MPDATVTHTLPGRAAKASEALPYALSVRMSTGQRAFLQTIAELHDVGVSVALRLVLDQAMKEVLAHDGSAPMWDLIESFTPDPDWLARHSEDAS